MARNFWRISSEIRNYNHQTPSKWLRFFSEDFVFVVKHYFTKRHKMIRYIFACTVYFKNNANVTFHMSLLCSFYLHVEKSLSPVGPASDKLLFVTIILFYFVTVFRHINAVLGYVLSDVSHFSHLHSYSNYIFRSKLQLHQCIISGGLWSRDLFTMCCAVPCISPFPLDARPAEGTVALTDLTIFESDQIWRHYKAL